MSPLYKQLEKNKTVERQMNKDVLEVIWRRRNVQTTNSSRTFEGHLIFFVNVGQTVQSSTFMKQGIV